MTVKEVGLSHPSESHWVEFDEHNEAHIARHHVTAEEVWQVFDGEPLWAANKKNMSATWLMAGRTYGGRALLVAVLYDADRGCIRPVTARNCDPEDLVRWSI